VALLPTESAADSWPGLVRAGHRERCQRVPVRLRRSRL